jgi:hypothetical protein
MLQIKGLVESVFGAAIAIKRAGVTDMSLKSKLVVLTLAAITVIAGLGCGFTNFKPAVTVIASAVWGN